MPLRGVAVVKRVGGWGVWLGVVALIAYLVVAPEHFHWDVRTYYAAADAVLSGTDPYRAGAAVEVGFVVNVLPFVYPPAIAVVLAPVALLPESVAIGVWLVVELAAVVAMVATWRRLIGPFPLDARLALLLLFGFDAALYTGIASGNVAVFEALALAVAFDGLLRDRPVRFAVLVVAAAAVKLVPIVYLPCLLVWGGPRRHRVLAWAVVAVAAIAVAQLVLAPAWCAEFWSAATALDERRWPNPTTLAFVRDVADRGFAIPPWPAYVVIVATVLAVTSWRVVRLRPAPRAIVPLLFVVAALVLPRFKNYTYVELLPAAIVCLRAVTRPARIALAALLGVVLPWSYLLVASPRICRSLETALPVSRDVWGYTALAGAFALWCIYLVRVLPRARTSH
jgi:alpha-1,2-mannosyltransferase